MASDYSVNLNFIKLSLETLGEPERRELKRGSVTARCHKGNYVLEKKTVLTELVTKFGKSLYQYRDLLTSS